MKYFDLNDIAIVFRRGRVAIIPKKKLPKHKGQDEHRIIPSDWDQSNLHQVLLCWVMHAVFYVPNTDQIYNAFYKIREFHDVLGECMALQDEAEYR